MNESQLWERFKRYFLFERDLGFAIDISRISFDASFFEQHSALCSKALSEMQELEAGALSNPDEKRMVGHYWLRAPELSPQQQLRTQIEEALNKVESFAEKIHLSQLKGSTGRAFSDLILVGIGGSALGPQFVTQALGSTADKIRIHFIDNTDPDGILRVVSRVSELSSTLILIVSKSGGTKETRNGQLELKEIYKSNGLDFSKHFVAVTGEGSELDNIAKAEGWLERFPMWDWVGGRTSEFSAVGLLPAALQGYRIRELLKGAAEMDRLTRRNDPLRNPALLMALMWYQVTDGKGLKDMVVLPYKDRLELFSRYLQQLVMESLGKERNLKGQIVNQGIAVYGNKGSTDQHAYVQQLRDGLNNFFVVFIEVLKDIGEVSALHATKLRRSDSVFMVEPEITSGDYLSGFLQGTRKALFDNQRQSISITIKQVDEFSVGMLIALFERSVGFYASFIGVNAYHQPGVEAGKKAATEVLKLELEVLDLLKRDKIAMSVDEVAQRLLKPEKAEVIYKILSHLAANDRVKFEVGKTVFEDRYSHF